jgi:hypothetical protein
MGQKLLKDVFPPIYKELLPSLFDKPAIDETRATCDNCAMCDQGKPSPVPMEYFKPDLKCCTYHPHLPNYLVGSILMDTDPSMAEGKERIRKKIKARIGVTPMRLSAPRKLSLHAAMSVGSGYFGRSEAIVCPYLEREKGLCTIWRHREGVCSTYYCKYTLGMPGKEFWRNLKEYIGYVEVGLERWSSKSIDPRVTEPNLKRGELTLEDLEDRAPNDEAYAGYWSQWVGREEEFYIECAKRVRALTKEQFFKIVHQRSEASAWLEHAQKLYEQAHRPILPSHLVRNKDIRARNAGDSIVLWTYNYFDAFSIATDLYDVLGMLDADQSLEENLKRLERDHDIVLDRELLRELYVQHVLAPPVKPEDPAKSVHEGPKVG